MSTQLAALAKENGELRTKLHDISLVLANEVASPEDLEELSTSFRDLSHRVSAPRSTAHPPPAAPAPLPKGPTNQGHRHKHAPQPPRAPQPAHGNRPQRPPPLLPKDKPQLTPALSIPRYTAPSMTPPLKRCSATPNSTRGPSTTPGRRDNFALANMTCRFSRLPPSIRKLDQNTSPPTLWRPAPPGPLQRAKEDRPPPPWWPGRKTQLQNPPLPSPTRPAVSRPSGTPRPPTLSLPISREPSQTSLPPTSQTPTATYPKAFLPKSMIEVPYPSPSQTPTPLPAPTLLTSMLSPAASIGPSPQGPIPGLCLPSCRPQYSWQFTQSCVPSSQKTTTNCIPSSSRPSRTRKRPRSSRPGTLTRTEILDYPRKRLQWLSPLTPTTWINSSQASSSSRSAARSRESSRPTAIPSAPIATDTDTHLPDAPRNTPRAHIAHFIIFVRPITAKTPPVPREDMRNLSLGAARPPPPTAPTAAATTMPSPGNAGLDQFPLLDQRPHHSPLLDPQATSRVKMPWIWRQMASKHPLLQRPLQSPTMQWTTPLPDSPPAAPQPPPMVNRLHPQAGLSTL